MWITQAATYHHFRDQTYLQNTWNITKMITLFSIIIHHSHRCFRVHIYMSITHFTIMFLIPWQLRIFQKIFITNSMETAEYWLMAHKYGIWNAAIASLQFWAEDFDPITLGIASECVYTYCFWTWTSHTLHQSSEEVLFGCFVVALNSAFTQQLSLADEGYESGSNKDLPTPLHKTPCIHHVSSMEHASFDPVHTTPCCPADTPHYDTQPSPLRPVYHHLTFLPDSSESDQDPDSPLNSSPDSSSDDEKDFQMVPIDDEHWTTGMAPERTFCIHEDGLPNNACQYPCPYGINNDTVSYIDSLEISDISNYKDYMMTTSDNEELQGRSGLLNSGLLEHLF